jgi:hypothetical protein
MSSWLRRYCRVLKNPEDSAFKQFCAQFSLSGTMRRTASSPSGERLTLQRMRPGLHNIHHFGFKLKTGAAASQGK